MKKVKGKHIGAYGVFIKNKKIVLIRKARGGYTGKFDLPGGGIEHEETPLEALFREVNEEAGLIVTSYKLIDAISTNIVWQMTSDTLEDLHHFGILYKINAKGKLKKDADGLDSNGACWYKIDELKESELTPFAIYSLKKLGYIVKKQ